MSKSVAVAVEAFEQALADLGVDELDVEPDTLAAVGRRAALLVAADWLWRRHLGASFDTREVQALLGGSTRQAVSDLVRRGRLLILPRSNGQLGYPAFQFDQTGRPFAVIAEVQRLFDEVRLDPYTRASWFVTAKEFLADQSPAEWLHAGNTPDQVVEAARRSTARLAQ